MPRLTTIPLALFLGAPALAQVDPSGIDFVTIGSPGNAPWAGDGTVGDHSIGRGSVDYQYRIGRFEVTTAQWCDFMNAAFDRPAGDSIPHVFAPEQWGAVATTPINPGGHRWAVPAGRGMIPVGGVDWRTCAIFCNWECNDRSGQRSAFLNGAYDVSTFGEAPIGFTDQWAHNPGARYYIPTFNEVLKAFYYDPNRFGAGQGGWWTHGNSSTSPLAYGPPGLNVRANYPYGPDPSGPLAQANAGWDSIVFPGHNPFDVALGAYSAVTTPWGLYDAAGGTTEWNEEVEYVSGIYPSFRGLDGSSWDLRGDSSDRIYSLGGEEPNIGTYNLGFRIAAAIPSPPSCGAMVLLAMLSALRRRRQGGWYEHQGGRGSVRRVRGSWGGDGRA